MATENMNWFLQIGPLILVIICVAWASVYFKRRNPRGKLHWFLLLLLSTLITKGAEEHIIKPIVEPRLPLKEWAEDFQKTVKSVSAIDLGHDYFHYLWNGSGEDNDDAKKAARHIPNLPGFQRIDEARSLGLLRTIYLLFNRIWKAFYYTLAIAFHKGWFAFIIYLTAFAVPLVFYLADPEEGTFIKNVFIIGIFIPLFASVLLAVLWLILLAFSVVFIVIAGIVSAFLAHLTAEEVKKPY